MAIDGMALDSWRPQALAVLRIVTGVIEVFLGALLLIGLFTRPVAFVLCGFMAVAYFMAHGSQGNVLLPMLNQGELAVLYCLVFLYFVFSGAGAWSVDALRHGTGARARRYENAL
jgi:putative oxidoreductase